MRTQYVNQPKFVTREGFEESEERFTEYIRNITKFLELQNEFNESIDTRISDLENREVERDERITRLDNRVSSLRFIAFLSIIFNIVMLATMILLYS